MKIGITGVAGMLGSHLSEILIKDGHEIIGIDDLSYGSLSNLEKVINNSNFHFMNFDVRINDLLRHAFMECDVFVHLAAVKKVVESQPSFETLDVNVSSTKNILELAKVTGAKVIFASTSDVYGSSTNLPFKEVEEILSKIEISLGRNEGQRGFSNRVIDLDILLFGSLVIEGKKSLPHKNLDSSLFVLEPLVELAADRIHPISKKTFKEILDNLKN